uniref:uncharacterized protein LOC122601280 n=1 Tax=Erigeron canadensis TaxID=72917 RepID=UPI001CB8B474|nr:uncharacterized protein LOC122601280 [Erigeron canadensis]
MTFAWFHSWCETGPLINMFSPRVISRAGFILQSTVKDVIADGNWVWPSNWNSHCVIPNLPVLDLEKKNEVLRWNRLAKVAEFSVSVAWEDIRSRADKVPWFRMEWFSQCIPKHALILWLVVKEKLKTQDLLQAWDYSSMIDVIVWDIVRAKANFLTSSKNWDNIVSDVI